MPYLFTPPTQQVAVESRHPFWRRTTDTVGRSVLKLADKQYVLVDDPSNEQIAASVLPYIGGHTYYISDLEAADLRDAGFGAFILPVPVDIGFGSGQYGRGVYGTGNNGTQDDTTRAYGTGIYGSGTYDGRG